jgi:hypothetical protein
MSLSYMVEAFHCRVGNATRKLILLKLADNADDTGYCFPSYQHIADQCECSKRVVIDHVKALVGQGLIKIVPRMGNRGQSSNGYQLLMDCRYKSRSAPKPDPSSTKLRGAESATPVDLTSEPSAPPSAEFAPPPSAESAPIISNSSETISEAAARDPQEKFSMLGGWQPTISDGLRAEISKMNISDEQFNDELLKYRVTMLSRPAEKDTHMGWSNRFARSLTKFSRHKSKSAPAKSYSGMSNRELEAAAKGLGVSSIGKSKQGLVYALSQKAGKT